MKTAAAAGDVALVKLDFLVGLPVCEAHKIVKYYHNHGFVEVFHLVCLSFLVRPRLPGDDA